jgi:hypothetical protein
MLAGGQEDDRSPWSERGDDGERVDPADVVTGDDDRSIAGRREMLPPSHSQPHEPDHDLAKRPGQHAAVSYQPSASQ